MTSQDKKKAKEKMAAAEKYLRNYLDIRKDAVGEDVYLSYEKILKLLTLYNNKQRQEFELLLEDAISNFETEELKDFYRQKFKEL